MWRRGAATGAIAATTITWLSCQVVGGYESFEERTDGGKPTPHPCDVLPRSKVDSKGLGTLVLVKPPDAACFWVDRAEVSVGQYRRFVDEAPNARADAGGAIVDPDRCAWKGAVSDPENERDHQCTKDVLAEPVPFDRAKPIRCVDWCDARAFCRWAGRDLCRSNTPATIGITEPVDVNDEWSEACSPEQQAFPYGPTLQEGLCNAGLSTGQCFTITQSYTCTPTIPDTFPKCISSAGALEMVGGVSEWVFSCSTTVPDAGPRGTRCKHRGGSFATAANNASCARGAGQEDFEPRDTRSRFIGFRCCEPLTAAEFALVQQK